MFLLREAILIVRWTVVDPREGELLHDSGQRQCLLLVSLELRQEDSVVESDR